MPGSTPAGSESPDPTSPAPPRAGYAPAPARVCVQSDCLFPRSPFSHCGAGACARQLLPRLIGLGEVVTLGARDTDQPGRPGVWFHQPDGPVGIVPFQFLVFLRAQIQGPDNRGAVNVGGIMDPLSKYVLRAVADEYQLLARSLRQALVDGNPPFRIAVIDEVPGLVASHCQQDVVTAKQVDAIPEEEVCGT